MLGVDGHDMAAVSTALTSAKAHSSQPSIIRCKTTIGYGAPTKAGTAGVHGAPLGSDEIAGARKALGWSHDPFVVPDDILSDWREAGRRGSAERDAWQNRHASSSSAASFDAAMAGDFSTAINDAVIAWCKELIS